MVTKERELTQYIWSVLILKSVHSQCCLFSLFRDLGKGAWTEGWHLGKSQKTGPDPRSLESQIAWFKHLKRILFWVTQHFFYHLFFKVMFKRQAFFIVILHNKSIKPPPIPGKKLENTQCTFIRNSNPGNTGRIRGAGGETELVHNIFPPHESSESMCCIHSDGQV